MEKFVKCFSCGKLGKNMLKDPHDHFEAISIYHSKRSETEYYYRCPYCKNLEIYLSDPPYYKEDGSLLK